MGRAGQGSARPSGTVGLALLVLLGLLAPAPAPAQTVVKKNLFSSDRRPPAPPQAVQARRQTLEEVRRTRLLGVMTLGGERKALLEAPAEVFDPGPKNPAPIRVWVKEGEMVGEFTLSTIEPTRATLSRGAESCVLEMPVRDRKKK